MSNNNILLEHDFKFVSYKSVDLLGRMTQEDLTFRQFCLLEKEPKYYKYFADPFRSFATLNVFRSSHAHTAAADVESLLRVKHINVSLELTLDFFIFDEVSQLLNSKTNNSSHNSYPYFFCDHNNDVDPIDSLSNIRSEIVYQLEKLGIHTLRHASSGGPNKCSITFASVDFLTAVNNILVAKYIIRNVAASYGKTATFMPKPNMSEYASLSASVSLDGMNVQNFALGMAQNIKALNAFTNPSRNGIKKLFLHEELSCIKIVELNKNTKKIEMNFVDCIANPVLAFSVMILAGISYDAQEHGLPNESIDRIKLDFSKNLDESLNLLQKNPSFFYNIIDVPLVDNYVNLVKNNESAHNLYIEASEIMQYYNM